MTVAQMERGMSQAEFVEWMAWHAVRNQRRELEGLKAKASSRRGRRR